MQLTEETVFGIVEALTNPMKDEGEWIAKLDIAQAGSKLNLEEQAEAGSCEVTCKTVQRAAEDIMEYAADTDVAEILWKVSRRPLTLATLRDGELSCIWRARWGSRRRSNDTIPAMAMTTARTFPQL